jgi:hypothetical protein
MRAVPAAFIAVLALLAALPSMSASALAAQSLAPAPSAVQHVTATPGANAGHAPAGTTVSLWVDVTPKPAIHVYAPGATDYQIVTLVMTPQRGLTFGKAAYPAGTSLAFPGIAERVPVYQKTFRITQPVTLARTLGSGQTPGKLSIAGAVNYQACDDRVCFPPTSLPVKWTLEVQ